MPRKARPYVERAAYLGNLCSRAHVHKDGGSYRDKHQVCLQCEDERQAARRADPDFRERRKAARELVKEREKPKDAAYRRRNADSLNAYNRAYMKAHPEKYRPCKRRSEARRKARRLHAMPAWADEVKIAEIYKEAQKMSEERNERMAVDHIVPLVSELVCGLHCEANLEILTTSENASKGNRWWPDEVANPMPFA